jgi:hypothetical protein
MLVRNIYKIIYSKNLAVDYVSYIDMLKSICYIRFSIVSMVIGNDFLPFIIYYIIVFGTKYTVRQYIFASVQTSPNAA